MEIARSTYYERRSETADDTAIVEAIANICEEFESYGWRRVRAALRHRGMVVNHKKIRRLMREHDLQPRSRRRHVTTTDSDHAEPIFPNRAAQITPTGPDQLWVADITYVPILAGFVYVAIILDGWSRCLRPVRRHLDRMPANPTETDMAALSQNDAHRTARIRNLNDAFRRTFAGGRVMMTSGIAALPDDTRRQIVGRIQTFDAFDPGNDPYGDTGYQSRLPSFEPRHDVRSGSERSSNRLQ